MQKNTNKISDTKIIEEHLLCSCPAQDTSVLLFLFFPFSFRLMTKRCFNGYFGSREHTKALRTEVSNVSQRIHICQQHYQVHDICPVSRSNIRHNLYPYIDFFLLNSGSSLYLDHRAQFHYWFSFTSQLYFLNCLFTVPHF